MRKMTENERLERIASNKVRVLFVGILGVMVMVIGLDLAINAEVAISNKAWGLFFLGFAFGYLYHHAKSELRELEDNPFFEKPKRKVKPKPSTSYGERV